uniref:Alpha-carbonic anhydrase domain-containing protein n=1 Tax=Periophthalmus magnuspinnatus TaxID=409849 RepID=A0A3B3ZPB1_9GOBI
MFTLCCSSTFTGPATLQTPLAQSTFTIQKDSPWRYWHPVITLSVYVITSHEHNYHSVQMHIVTKRKDLTLDEAVMTGNGLAVLGFFMESPGDTKNSGGEEMPSRVSNSLQKLTSLTQYTIFLGTMAKFSAEVSIDDLLGDVDRGMYYRYNGSLTTPSCNEAVVWTVFKYPIKVEKSLMQMFPTKMEYHNVYRPVQDFHSRTIYTSAAAASNLPTFLVLLLLSSSHVLSE